MNTKKHLQMIIRIFLLSSLLVSACSSKKAISTPTLSLEQVQTQAVATFGAGLTQTAIALPTNTPTPTNTSTPTETNTPLPPQATSTSVLPTNSCFSLAFLSDVTIPDNTEMAPGEKFTKTWQVRNNGSCVWEAGFKLTFSGGNALGGASLILTKAVSPGTATDLSIFMTAPAKAGSYQSNWRMTNSAGVYFGDEMYAVINVTGSTLTATISSSSATPTPTVSNTPEETPTETPAP
ncbi:MAG: NBR1-Ig-like domain-containing protein [Anaerolineales bacterium]|nr:NBR1-Ig-like domain-containing protein [Anaerolineales bacterium]